MLVSTPALSHCASVKRASNVAVVPKVTSKVIRSFSSKPLSCPLFLRAAVSRSRSEGAVCVEGGSLEAWLVFSYAIRLSRLFASEGPAMLYYELLSGASVALAATIVVLSALAVHDNRSIGRVQEQRLRHLKGLRIGVYTLLCASQAAIVALRLWTHGLPRQPNPSDVEELSSFAAWLTLLVSPTHPCTRTHAAHGAWGHTHTQHSNVA